MKYATVLLLALVSTKAMAQNPTPSERLQARARAFQDSLDEADKSQRELARKKLIRSLKLPQHIERAAVERRIVVGMPTSVVRLSWGEPEEINYTTTAAGTTEQWVYDIKTYLYVRNGVVTGIQGSYRP